LNEEQFAFPLLICNQILSCFSPSTIIQIWWYLFLNFSKINIIHIWHFLYVILFLGCCLYTLYCSL
jgi:hypothetical protein